MDPSNGFAYISDPQIDKTSVQNNFDFAFAPTNEKLVGIEETKKEEEEFVFANTNHHQVESSQPVQYQNVFPYIRMIRMKKWSEVEKPKTKSNY